MRFTFWFYACKFCTVLFPISALYITFDGEVGWRGLLGQIGLIAIALLMAMALVGAVMGVLSAFGRLEMFCPFCGRKGQVGGNRKYGLWLVCKQCGFVHGAGYCGLRLVKEPLELEEFGKKITASLLKKK